MDHLDIGYKINTQGMIVEEIYKLEERESDKDTKLSLLLNHMISENEVTRH